MRQPRTSPATDEEVIAALTLDPDRSRVRGTVDVAHSVWLARGGTGSYPPQTDHPVPVVRADHVRPALDRLVRQGRVATASGRAAAALGRVLGGARANGHYYTLAEYAREVEEAHDRFAALVRQADDTARELRETIGDLAQSVTGTAHGTVTITCTGEQARALLETLRARA